MNEYCTMKEIGKIYDITSHKVGRILKEARLRTQSGKPSGSAFELDMVQQLWTSDYQNYAWAWHKVKTSEVIEATGLRPIV